MIQTDLSLMCSRPRDIRKALTTTCYDALSTTHPEALSPNQPSGTIRHTNLSNTGLRLYWCSSYL